MTECKVEEKVEAKPWGKHATFKVRGKYKFDVEVEHIGEEPPEIKLFDFGDESSCLAAGLEMVALKVATPEQVKKACQEARQKRKVPKEIPEQLGLDYDGFLHCYIGFAFNKSFDNVVSEVRNKLNHLCKLH